MELGDSTGLILTPTVLCPQNPDGPKDVNISMMARTPAILLAVALMPTMASADLFKPSKADQVKLGQQAAAEVRSKEKILPASDIRVQTLRKIGAKVLATFDDSKEPWKYSFDVVDSKEINAFALPGGPVFFYTGLLNKMESEDEIAAVVAHELIHVRREHWAYAYADSQKRNLLLTGILIFGKVGRTAGDLLSLGNDVILGLPFSRKHESEADTHGFTAMVDAGYNPQGMVDVFTFLSKNNKGKPPEFLSTHPDDGKRIERIKSMVANSGKTYRAEIPVKWETTTYIADKSLRWHW